MLALPHCCLCHGAGWLPDARFSAAVHPCKCACRIIFRTVLDRYRYCRDWAPRCSHGTSLELIDVRRQAASCRLSYCRRDQEFVADVELVSRRHLGSADWRLFRLHFLDGFAWRECCRRLGVDRGSFFHAVYAIEQRLGRVFRDLRPYPLYPLESYFGSASWERFQTGPIPIWRLKWSPLF